MAGGVKDSERLEALLKESLEEYKLHEEAWDNNRKLALEDIKFRSGDHWPETIKKARTEVGNERPMLVVDKLNQYVRQVVNDARQNRPAVKVRPIDDDGDIEVASAFDGLIRHIYEKSNGDLAVDNATECAVVGGYGYYRLATEYAHEKTFNQDICIKKIGNPLAVMLGIPGENPMEAKNGFIIDEMPRKAFKKQYPDAKFTDFDADGKKYSEGWLSEETIRYCERFYVEEVPTTMHLLDDDTVASDEEYQAALLEGVTTPKILESRVLPQRKVKWCRMSGAEILEESEWLGKYIPIIRVVGNEYNLDGEVIYSGLVRAAKDPQRLYNYMRSAFAERVALTPKSPWLIAEGQIEGHEEEWKTAHSEPAFLVFKETSLDGHPVPPPQRVSATDIPEGFARDMQLSEHDIQASMGMYAASVGQPSNERSGKAIMARQREGDTATFHYQDNASRGIRDLGTMLVDLIPKIIDSKRKIRILGEDGESREAEHDPMQEEPVINMGDHSIYNLGVGTYDVAVVAGPSFTTRRVEQAEAMGELIHNSPETMQIIGDLFIKAQDWPNAEETAERFKLMLPPPIQAALAAKKQGIPPEAQAVIIRAQQAVQERDQQLQELNRAMQNAQQKIMELEAKNAQQTGKNATDTANFALKQANAELENMRKESELIKAQNDLIEAQRGETGEPPQMVETEQGVMPFDQWKVLVENSTKVLIAEIQSKTTVKTASMSANSANGGKDGTTVDENGTSQASPALTALIEAVNNNMETLMQGNQSISEGLMALSKPRVAKRDKNGNLYSELVQ